jgi:hypothetical protein
MYEYRYDEKLKTKTEESTRLTETGLVVELELDAIGAPSRLRLIRKAAVLASRFHIFDLS